MYIYFSKGNNDFKKPIYPYKCYITTLNTDDTRSLLFNLPIIANTKEPDYSLPLVAILNRLKVVGWLDKIDYITVVRANPTAIRVNDASFELANTEPLNLTTIQT